MLCIWITVDILGIFYMLSKAGVTAIVMVYNFVTRKIFIEGKGEDKLREKSVSYTHLDVYKRQLWSKGNSHFDYSL